MAAPPGTATAAGAAAALEDAADAAADMPVLLTELTAVEDLLVNIVSIAAGFLGEASQLAEANGYQARG